MIKGSQSGFRGQCKQCEAEYRKGNASIANERTRLWREQNREIYLKKGKLYRQENKDALLPRAKQYKKDNKESIKEQRRQYDKEYALVNKEVIRERAMRYRQENKEVVTEKAKCYKKEHREKFRVYRQLRRTRIKQLPATLTVQQWENTKQYFDNKCAYCGKEKQLSQDHFFPLSKGGGYTNNNIVPACLSCNSSKGNRDFFEWYSRQKFYSKRREESLLLYLGYEDNAQQLVLM